ncbi:MAG: GPP34 family phosphoprotein [Gammaproteobacteria bacterium]|nr:GPP34 family phosphoprotein [Gammaproteobacteria bacterium]
MSEFNLTIAEEIVLLILDDENGAFHRLPDWSIRYALSGALLMELAEMGRIDTDLERLFVIKEDAIDNDLLNSLLQEIVKEGGDQNIRFWVERTAVHSDLIKEHALSTLVDKGILEQKEQKFLWVFRSRKYPIVDGRAEKEVKLRLFEVLFSDALPSPRDVVLLCLAHACGVLKAILPRRELDRALDRIEQVRRLDLIGQAVAKAIWDIEVSIAVSSHPQFM